MELSSFYGPTHLINMNGWAMTPWNTFPNVKCLVYAATQGTMPEDVAARAKDNADYDSQYFVLNDDGDAVVTPLALFPDTNIFFVEYDRQAYLPAIVGKTNSGGKKVNYLNELNGFANYYVLSDAKPGYPSWYKINYEIDKDLSSRESPGSSSGQRFYDFSGNGTPPKTRVYLSAPFNRKISDFYKYEINGTSYDTNNSTTDSNGYDGVAFQLYQYQSYPFFQVVGSLDEQWPQIIVDTYSPEWYEWTKEIFPKIDMDNSTPAQIRVKMAASPTFSSEVDFKQNTTTELGGTVNSDTYSVNNENAHSDEPFEVSLSWGESPQTRTPYANTAYINDQKKFYMNLAPFNKAMGILYNTLYGTNGNITSPGTMRNVKYLPSGDTDKATDYQAPTKNRRGILEQMWCLNGFFNVFTGTEDSNEIAKYWEDGTLKTELIKFATEVRAIIYPLYDRIKNGTNYINKVSSASNEEKSIYTWIAQIQGLVEEFYSQFKRSSDEKIGVTSGTIADFIRGLKVFYNWIKTKYSDTLSTFSSGFPVYYEENYNVTHPINNIFTPVSFTYKLINGEVTTNLNYTDTAEVKTSYVDGKLNDQKTSALNRDNIMVGRAGYSFLKSGVSPDCTIIRCKLAVDTEITDIAVYYGQIGSGESFILPTSVRIKYGASEQDISHPFGEADTRSYTERDNAEANASRVSKFYAPSSIRARYIDVIFENDDEHGIKKGAYGLGIDEIMINGKPAIAFETIQQQTIGEFFQFYKEAQPQIQKLIESSFDSDNTVLFVADEKVTVDKWNYESASECWLAAAVLKSPETWDKYGLQIQKNFSVAEFALDDNISNEELDEIIYNDIQIQDDLNFQGATGQLDINSENRYQTSITFKASTRPTRPLTLSALITF